MFKLFAKLVNYFKGSKDEVTSEVVDVAEVVTQEVEVLDCGLGVVEIRSVIMTSADGKSWRFWGRHPFQNRPLLLPANRELVSEDALTIIKMIGSGVRFPSINNIVNNGALAQLIFDYKGKQYTFIYFGTEGVLDGELDKVSLSE